MQPIITEQQQPQLKEMQLIFFYKKWIDSVNVKKFSIEIFSNNNTLNNWVKLKNIKPKSDLY